MTRLGIPALLLVLAWGCVAPARSVRQGDAYSYVMDSLQAPPVTRVFVQGQYSPSELPQVAWIGNVGYASLNSSTAKIEQAREEGRRLKADFVLVYTTGSGVASSLGLAAFRLLPVELGYRAQEGVVSEVLPQAAASGLQVGDKITMIGDVPFSARVRRVFAMVPGEKVSIRVLRAGTEHVAEVSAGANPPKHLDLPEAKTL